MTAPVSLFVCPPASPSVAITVRRLGKRSYSADDLVRHGSLPPEVLPEARAVLPAWRNVLVSGGTASGKTTLLNALIELLPEDERIVSIEDTLELRMDWSNCVRFEARGIDSGSVTSRDLVRHALRHRPDHIAVGEVLRSSRHAKRDMFLRRRERPTRQRIRRPFRDGSPRS